MEAVIGGTAGKPGKDMRGKCHETGGSPIKIDVFITIFLGGKLFVERKLFPFVRRPRAKLPGRGAPARELPRQR
jgi:hypothetical protein